MCQLKGSGALRPQRGAGRSPAAFFRHGLTRAKRACCPCRFFPFPHPMDEVRGGKMFWRQLNSRFGYGQIRNLGSYKKTKIQTLPAVRVPRTTGREGKREKREAWGLFVPKPLTRMSVGRNGHDGAGGAWPDPLLRSLDPISGRIAHKLETPQLPENILGSYYFY